MDSSLPDRMIPGVLDSQERRAVEKQFGVGGRQVVRDHVISHGLAAIATAAQGDVVFFGGTALSRTLLPELRLSEDIDLITLGNKREVGARIEAEIRRKFRRTLGAVTFNPPLGQASHSHPSILEVKGTRIQVQLLPSKGYPSWPRQLVDLEQRHRDAPPARLHVLTPPAFVASKLAAWEDRHAPRDLYDLWSLAERGWIDEDAAALYCRYGQHATLSRVSFAEVPSEREWEGSLAHQCVIKTTPKHAATVVRDALAALSS